MTPQRLQRKRTKDWKMPENTAYVGRPTVWGNPYYAGGFALGSQHTVPGHIYDAGDAVECFELSLKEFCEHWPQEFNIWIAPLRGKNLACWCRLSDPCHADALLKMAKLNFNNQPTE